MNSWVCCWRHVKHISPDCSAFLKQFSTTTVNTFPHIFIPIPLLCIERLHNFHWKALRLKQQGKYVYQLQGACSLLNIFLVACSSRCVFLLANSNSVIALRQRMWVMLFSPYSIHETIFESRDPFFTICYLYAKTWWIYV